MIFVKPDHLCLFRTLALLKYGDESKEVDVRTDVGKHTNKKHILLNKPV